jgi:hypothetical protein
MIDSEDLTVGSNLLSLWSSCVALLPALGGSGIQGMQLKTNWIELCCQLVYAIHGCIDSLFTNITEIKVKFLKRFLILFLNAYNSAALKYYF